MWIVSGIMVIVLGVYRDYLHREKDSRQQKEQMETQKRMLEKQTAIENRLNELVKQGKITKEAAQEILTTTIKASSQVTVEGEVIRKPSSPDEMNTKKNK